MTHILCLAGREGSGKTTAAKFLDRNGWDLVHGPIEVYSLAEPLKDLCVDLLGLTLEQAYGTEEQKNTPTDIQWENVPNPENRPTVPDDLCGSAYKTGPMTAREVLQYVGTEIFRRLRPGCWIEKCLCVIAKDAPNIAVVDDARFPDEIAALRQKGKAVLLTRGAAVDGQASENSLPGPEAFDLVIDNAAMTMEETHQALADAMRGWGWLSE